MKTQPENEKLQISTMERDQSGLGNLKEKNLININTRKGALIQVYLQI